MVLPIFPLNALIKLLSVANRNESHIVKSRLCEIGMNFGTNHSDNWLFNSPSPCTVELHSSLVLSLRWISDAPEGCCTFDVNVVPSDLPFEPVPFAIYFSDLSSYWFYFNWIHIKYFKHMGLKKHLGWPIISLNICLQVENVSFVWNFVLKTQIAKINHLFPLPYSPKEITVLKWCVSIPCTVFIFIIFVMYKIASIDYSAHI